MSEIRYETPYTQNFYHKGVDLSPQEHAQGRMDALRAASVEAARLDPNVGSVQYGTLVGNGVGNDWAVVFSDKDYNVAVQFDENKKNRITGVRTRKFGYTLSVTLIQECRPMTGNPAEKPRQIMATLS
ncbi:hypothetical protein HDV57DRAFT_488465 [Trichoderma longibrachiatum]